MTSRPLTVALLLVACKASPPAIPLTLPQVAEAPAPVAAPPPPAPTEPAAQAPTLAALRKTFSDAEQKLNSYQALPRCVPSGAVVCADRQQAGQADDARRQAWAAILAAERAQAALRLARARVEAFRAIVSDLNVAP